MSALATHSIPVILDTDIGDDIDDTWALAMLLRCPELDLRLVTTDMGREEYRARLSARLLDVAGRSDVPVGLGCAVPTVTGIGDQALWVADYPLESYPGTIIKDGTGAMIETIMSSPVPVTIIAIGPLPTVAAALEREPRIARNARFVGMHGSFYRTYGGEAGRAREYNVDAHPVSCTAVFAAPWLSATITPLDTCGTVQLTGVQYQRVLTGSDPLMRAVIDNYRIWCESRNTPLWEEVSTVLFDTVAVHLAWSRDYLACRTTGVSIADNGLTVEDPDGAPFEVAFDWTNEAGYRDYLVERLLMPIVPPQRH